MVWGDCTSMFLSCRLKFRWSCKILAHHNAVNLSNIFMIDISLLAHNCELYFCIVNTQRFVLLFFCYVVGNVMFWQALTEINALWEWISVCCQGVSPYWNQCPHTGCHALLICTYILRYLFRYVFELSEILIYIPIAASLFSQWNFWCI